MLAELTITELQAQMASGELTAQALTEKYLERIDQIDQGGPTLNAVLVVNPEAREIAAALDAERKEKGARGPLHGIPVLLKDNLDTADQMPTTAGSLALAGSIAPRDAFVTEKLRRAGAIILGKANLSEWANFRSTHSVSGWSSLGGQVRHPYALDRNPCGSSSGSAVAVAANLCAAAIGTETDGSIICPSSINGIVGIKPTVGLVSRSGIVPISHSQDTAGPMGRTVADATVLLGALTGLDPRDPATASSMNQTYTDYAQFLQVDGLRGARIGVARNYFGKHLSVDQIMEEALEIMRQAGAEIIDPVNLETVEQLSEPERVVLLYEFKADLNEYLAQRGPDAPVHSLAEIIEFNEQNREQVMPWFGQELMLLAQEKGPLTEKAYRRARAKCLRLAATEGIDAALAAHKLDAIIAPSNHPAWLTDWVNGDRNSGGSAAMTAVAGYPNVTVPAGFVHGLPVGISFMGGAYQEPTLIRLAYAFEQITCFRQPPRYLPTLFG